MQPTSASARNDGVEHYLRAVVAYDGTDFRGFQIQNQGLRARTHSDALRTVQGVLEEALERITRERVRLVGAGRTDAGVHALGQVVAFTTHWRHSWSDLHRAWNAVLSDDVAVLSLCRAQREFHPRFDAASRVYRYTIWNHPVRNPLLRRTVLWEPRQLDVSSMAVALELLIGEHDFATFGTSPGGRQGSTVRRILAANAYRCQSARCAQCAVYIDIEANAFLYRMVRSIVGTVLEVGRGALSVVQFASAFAAKDRSQAGPTAPPHGLCLMDVNY